MPRLPLAIALLLAVALPAGCRTAPWWSSRATARSAGAPDGQQPGGLAASDDPSAPAGDAADPQSLQAMMAELHELGTLDPEARDQLMSDLQQTDPAVWPLLVRQFRAAAAYRRREADRGTLTPQSAVSSTASSEARSDPSPHRLPSADQGPLPPDAPPRGAYPTTPSTVAAVEPAGASAALQPSSEAASESAPPSGGDSSVQQAAFRSGDDWQLQLASAVRAAESQIHPAPQSETDVAAHARLRVLYLLAGRRDDAMRPIPSVSPATQQFWSNQVYALATWLDAERQPDSTRRAAETKRILDEAVARLGESAPLVVRNLAFCTEIQSYGSATKFRTNEFTPGQEVLLYVEIENFASEATPRGHHTALRSSYQIFDNRGQRVDEHDFTTTEEHCQNPRRDFFIGYHLRMPERIYPGQHTLKLSVEDLKSKKVGEASIDFTIRAGRAS